MPWGLTAAYVLRLSGDASLCFAPGSCERHSPSSALLSDPGHGARTSFWRRHPSGEHPSQFGNGLSIQCHHTEYPQLYDLRSQRFGLRKHLHIPEKGIRWSLNLRRVSPVARAPKVKADLLNSWKEIASYLGRGVRTVQRWEQDSYLPVHRLNAGRVGPVFAFPSELDMWLNGALREALPKDPEAARTAITRNQLEKLAASRARSRQLMRELSERTLSQQQRTQRLMRTLQLITQRQNGKTDQSKTHSPRVA